MAVFISDFDADVFVHLEYIFDPVWVFLRIILNTNSSWNSRSIQDQTRLCQNVLSQ